MEGKPIKVALKIYAHERTLHREFSSYDEVWRVVELMVEKDPDVIIQPFVQLTDSEEIALSKLVRDEFADFYGAQDSDSFDFGEP